MQLTFTYPIILIILAILFAAGAVYWVYSHTVPALSPGRRWLLGSLRFAILVIVFVLLAEPLIQRLIEEIEPPILAVLVDESESMSITSSDTTSGGDATLRDLLRRVAASTDGERVRVFGFGDRARDLGALDSISFAASRTDISGGLDHVRAQLENEAFGAVLLISDGRHNGGRNPEHLADLYPVPIVSLTVGDTTAQQDIRIQQVLRNDLSYVGREVPIRVRVRNEGFEPARIRVELSGSSESLDQESVALPPQGSEVEVELNFVPDSVGLFQYRVDITRLRGELTHRNNTEQFPLQVLERERRVLLMAGAPSPDVAALRQLLAPDSDTELVARTLKEPSGGTYYEGPFPEDPEDFDLIILVGFPALGTSAADLDRIVAEIEGGTPVLFVAGRASDLAAVQRRLATLLPARPAVIRPGYVEGALVPTQQAMRHAVFDITERSNFQRWASLPPLALNQTRWEAQPGAVTLATTRIRGISIDDPVLVVGRVGARRSAALLGSGFWRWNNVPEDLQDESERWRELFSNLVLWLVTEDDDRLVRVAPVESLLDESDPVIFSGQVYDENLQPLSDVSVSLEIRHPTGEDFPYAMQSLGNGQYRADLGSFPEGTYEYEAVATLDSGELGRDRGSFTVGELSLEFRNPSADRRLMRQVARRSGGTTVEQDSLEELPSILASLPTYRPATRITESQLRLWRYLPLLFALLILMTAEWFFRKRFGLV